MDDTHDPDIARYYRELREPGRVNARIADTVQATGTLPVTAAPCDLCTLPDRDDIEVAYADEEGYVAVLNELKGHDDRLLAAIHDHGRLPDDRGAYRERLLGETAARIGDGHMVAYGRMGTYHGHWHVVASDMRGDDLPAIHDAALYRVDDGAYEKVWERPEPERSTTGELIFYD